MVRAADHDGLGQIAGLGPGLRRWSRQRCNLLLASTDVVGYIPYVARVPKRPCLTLHASDNRVELERAQDALKMALAGKKVVVVSSGDPGVFAMAAAVFEAVESGPMEWRSLEIGTSRYHVLTPPQPVSRHRWDMISVRSISATTSTLDGDRKTSQARGRSWFCMGFIIPDPKRVEGFARVLDILREAAGPDVPIFFARPAPMKKI